MILAGFFILFCLCSIYLIHRVNIGPPLIYMSTRLGYMARPFTLYKIRTLKSVPNSNHLSTCSTSDPRTSILGNFLRSSKIDEIPQFLNLLLGQINLIGPRPNVPSEFQFYTPAQFSLFSSKPGITDLSSIYLSNLGQIIEAYEDHGDSNQVYRKLVWPIKSYLQLLYLENRTFLLDIQILFLTLLCLVSRRYSISLLKPLLVSLNTHSSIVRNLGLIPDIKTISNDLLDEPSLSYFYNCLPYKYTHPILPVPTKLLFIVPVKNGEKYFLESLLSFKRFSNNASLEECQLLYVYSPSNDSTLDLLDTHLRDLPNVNYIQEPYPGLGIAINTNVVVHFADAEKICWLGIDDRLESTFNAIFHSIVDHDLVFFQYQHINANSFPIYTSHFKHIDLFIIKNIKNYVSFPSLVFSRKIYLSSGGMIQQHGNDLDLIIKLTSISSSHTVCDTILSSFRIHQDSRTSNLRFRLADLKADLRVVYCHGALPVNAYLLRMCYHQFRRIIGYASKALAHWTNFQYPL